MFLNLIPFMTIWTFVNCQKFRMDYMWAHAFKTFYKLHDLATNWHQARHICEAEGTTLLVPGSIEEMENLKLLISNMKARYTAIFIGIHDQFSESDFVTTKGEPIADTILELLWTDGRPEKSNGTENCVVMTREGLLDDRSCSDIYPFVCKILGNETKYNDKCDGFDMEAAITYQQWASPLLIGDCCYLLTLLTQEELQELGIFEVIDHTTNEPLGYFPHENGKCYKFHDEPLTWHDAYLLCMLEEGRLCIINTAQEASFVVSLLGEHLNNIAPDANILHIGFSDLMFPFQYRTIAGETLEEAGYASWTPLQEGKTKPSNYRCGALSKTGFLKTISCSLPAMFLCEKEQSKDSKQKHR